MMASLEASKEEVYVPLPPSAEGSPELSGVGKDADLQDASADFKYASTPCHPGQEQYRPFAYRRPLTSLSLSTYGTVDSCLPAVRSPFIGGPSGAERPIAHADDPHAHTMDNCVPEQQSFPYIEHGKDANYDVHGEMCKKDFTKHMKAKGMQADLMLVRTYARHIRGCPFLLFLVKVELMWTIKSTVPRIMFPMTLIQTSSITLLPLRRTMLLFGIQNFS
ncbi:hypothetical protein KP509_1Z328700 [Ceratopteris richardii]|nr:hypothetical protein KP509_1Z328700 [Ceratopteris richardii]